MPTDLECRSCSRTYAAGPDEPWRCDCGHALDFVAAPRPEGDPLPVARIDTRRGVWTFDEFLPVDRRVTLGEGFTPLVDAPDWDAAFKLEYVLPTGSFKDRGATTTLSRAVDLGVEKVVEDSSGNAGAAIATYAARAGVEADVYVPDDVKQSKLVAIQRAGARPIRVEGDRADVTAAAIDAVEDGDGWYASHAWNPAFFAGTATMAFEVAAQRDWTAPDAVVLPVGHGTLLLGAYRGFRALYETGCIERMPRLLAAQATGYAPVVEAVGGETDAADEAGAANGAGAGDEDDVESALAALSSDDDETPANEVADGVHVRAPAREDQIVTAVTATGGDAVAVGEGPVELALDRLHRAGFYVEPTAAVAVAALAAYRRDGVLSPEDDVVVPLTGSGMKTL